MEENRLPDQSSEKTSAFYYASGGEVYRYIDGVWEKIDPNLAP